MKKQKALVGIDQGSHLSFCTFLTYMYRYICCFYVMRGSFLLATKTCINTKSMSIDSVFMFNCSSYWSNRPRISFSVLHSLVQWDIVEIHVPQKKGNAGLLSLSDSFMTGCIYLCHGHFCVVFNNTNVFSVINLKMLKAI